MVDKHSLESTEGAFGNVPDDIEVPQRPQRPIQWFVAGASIVSHGSVAVFGRATHRTLDKIIQDKVIVQKGIVEHQVWRFLWPIGPLRPRLSQSSSLGLPSAIKKRSWREQPEGQAYPREVCL